MTHKNHRVNCRSKRSKKKKANWLRLAFAAFIVFITTPFTALAVSFSVNTTTDAPDINLGDGLCQTSTNLCSLRAAIMETNALVNEVIGADEINIPDGTYLLRVLNAGGVQENLSATGDLDITDSLIITGNITNKAAVVIDAGGQFNGIKDRVFHVTSNKDPITVEFNYLVIKGGYSADTRAGGGGLCIQCIASNSEAYQPTGLGSMSPDINTTFSPTINPFVGNIPRPIVTLRFVDVIDNVDIVSGSGIMSAGVLTIEDSVLQNNSSDYRFGEASGQNGRFRNNSQFVGGGNGGAIANWGGKLTIRRSLIDGNNAQTGGAIYSQTILAQFRDEQVLIENSQIVNNTAFMGGGIFNVSGDWDYPARKFRSYGFVINQSTIDNNQAEYAGAGIYNLGVAAMQLSNVTVSNNSASDVRIPALPNKGGGIYHSGKILDLVNTTVSGNVAQSSRRMGMGAADDASGGDEVFIDVTQANVDPLSTLPWRFSVLNSVVGEAASDDSCNGTLGYENFITDVGGNVDDSGTCFFTATPVVNGGAAQKILSSVNISPPTGAVLGELANNGGLPGNELPDGTFPPTRALLSGGAIGLGANCNQKDQRGFGRVEEICDAGAFQTSSNTKGVSTNTLTQPIARADSIVTPLGVDVFLPISVLLSNDNDPLQRGTIEFEIGSVMPIDPNGISVQVRKGTQANNTAQIDFISFRAASGFVGETGFTYKVNVVDPESGLTVASEAARVTVIVSNVNVAPVAYSQQFSIAPSATKSSDLIGDLSSGVLSFDPEGPTLQFYAGERAGEELPFQGLPTQGEVALAPDGTFIYTAYADAKGTDSFAYYVEDNQGLASKYAVVTIYISAISISSVGDVTVSVEAGRIVSVDLSGGATGRFFFGLKRGAILLQGEILWINENTGQLLYIANANGIGSDTFEFTVVDLEANNSAGDTSSYDGVVTINILAATDNLLPTANENEVSLNSGVINKIYLNVSDAENDVQFFMIKKLPTKGKITDFDPATGTVTYIANPQSSGVDELSFSVSDGRVDAMVESTPATVTINLTAQQNTPPVANDDAAMTPNNLPIKVNVLRNDLDENGDDLQITLSAASDAFEIRGNGIIQYMPPAGFVGDDVIGYEVSDNNGGVATAKLKVTVIAASDGDYVNFHVIPVNNIEIPMNDSGVASSGKPKNSWFGSVSPLFVLFGFILLYGMRFGLNAKAAKRCYLSLLKRTA